MLILHASSLDQQLLLWGEAGPDEPRSRAGRKGATPVPAWPFDPGAKTLLATLAELFPHAAEWPRKGEPVVLWCPTAGDRPVASSPLIAEPPPADAALELKPWSVTAVRLPLARAAGLLADCVGRDMFRAGVKVGRTLAYWSAVLRFAAALVTREQFLPGVRAKPPSLRACWEPVLAGDDAHRLAQLARAMPAACRALSATADTPPQTAPAALVETVVRALVDELVRSSLGPVPAPTPARRRAALAFDSIHDQWLHALRSGDARMEEHAEQQPQLAGQVADWQRPVAVTARAPFRLCFRLEEPAAGADGKTAPRAKWHLRYLLQARDDPSLLVPVAEAWAPRGKKAAVLKRDGFRPREYLLQVLGQAAAIDPGVEASLKDATPSGYTLDASGAHAFLTERASLLEQAGFGVLLPAWWTRKGTKQRLGARAFVKSGKLKGQGLLSLDSIVAFDWQVALGDQTLTREELEALARLKAPLVQVRGQWVELSPEEIQAALDFWKKKGGGETTLRELVKMALGASSAAGPLPFEGVQATGWVGDFLGRLEGRDKFEEWPAPAGFRGTLRPYQTRGYSWLGFLGQWGLGACLADDMGLGKTVQTLALLQRQREAGRTRPTLLVCPMSVVGNWQKEAERFAPELPVLVHHGLKRIKGAAFRAAAEQHALVLSSYALLHRDLELFRAVPWDGVILDEAQNIKNPETKQAKAARALPAEYRVALTGTPVENHVGDLWSVMEFLNPGFLGGQADFRRSFLLPIQAHNDADAAARLRRLTGPFVLRRLKTDKTVIADLPDKLEMKVFCNLTKEQATLYEAVVKDGLGEIEGADEGIQRKGQILAMLTRLKQVCNHPTQFLGDNSALPGRSGKLARLTEMLEEVLEVGDRVLVFTQFTEMGELIKKHLQETFGREVLFLHGGVPKKQRDRMVERFQGADGDGERPQVFLLSLKAGGTGLNLTAANHVFHFDRWWNPAVENQATDRAFRIGQQRNVQVHKFVCVGTVEERIDEMIERKQEIAGQVVGTGEQWLTEMSNQQLKDLFALRASALGE